MSQAPAGTVSSAAGQPPGLLVRFSGGLLVLTATVLVALLESFYVLLRLGSVRIPVSMAIAIVLHPLLTWLMRAATRSGLAMLAPFAVWLAVVLPLGLRRAEGDLVVAGNNWVSTALLFGGSLLFAGSIGALRPVRGRTGRSTGR